MFALVMTVAVTAIVLCLFMLYRVQADAAASLLRKAKVLVAEHLTTLTAKRLQLITTDDYGVEDLGPWARETDYFIQNVLEPTLTKSEMEALKRNSYPVSLLIETATGAEQARLASSRTIT